ncbi:MAG: phosphotransferase family protein [Pseudonocardia sp.]
MLPFALPRGHIHGDANVGNVICDDRGHAVLIDLDSFAIGAREWDLIQTALFFDRLGWHTEEEYREFVEVYGYDITSRPARSAVPPAQSPTVWGSCADLSATGSSRCLP